MSPALGRVHVGIPAGSDCGWLAGNLPQPAVLLADRGYPSYDLRKAMQARDAVPVIPMRQTRALRVALDRTL